MVFGKGPGGEGLVESLGDEEDGWLFEAWQMLVANVVGFISLAFTIFVFLYEILKAVGCSFRLLSFHFFVIEMYHLLSPLVPVFRVPLMGNLVMHFVNTMQ